MSLNANSLIVIKVGSSSLTNRRGVLAPEKLAEIARQICVVKAMGHRVILVSSGAIAAGFRRLGFPSRPTVIAEKQACAAVGQGLLMEEYNRCFSEAGVSCGQLLLTRGDFADRRRFRNAFSALQVLLDRGAVPIINENDTVAVEELKIGDNDTLSAQVAAMVHADLLLLLTDIDGLYTADPSKDPTARHIDVVERIDATVLSAAAGAGSSVGTGGMKTKLSGAHLATEAGVKVFICSSSDPDCIPRALAGTVRGTLFLPHEHSMKTRQQWIAFYADCRGTVYIDPGAAEALTVKKKSLLPPGVVRAEGDFRAGDTVNVCVQGTDVCLGRGIVNFSREELMRLAVSPGTHKEAIHRDNWIQLN
jgi:glutamate 5-kinase